MDINLILVYNLLSFIVSFFLFFNFITVYSFQLLSTNPVVITRCDHSSCLHGICWPNDPIFPPISRKCYCFNGFTGSRCQINYDECLLTNCLNNGTCVDGVGEAHCLCPTGLTGKYCEQEINECATQPCLSGGTCLDGVNSYQCLCPYGYSGHNCEVDVSVCNETLSNTTISKCLNNGECLEGPGASYRCRCRPGFQGNRCEKDINECLPNPCGSDADCIDLVADFQCICPYDRTGKRCESKLSKCEKNSCGHQALCLMIDGNESSIKCFCVPGYYGVHCERHFNECMPIKLCENGGLCIEGEDNYSCSCLSEFAGKHCEIDCRISPTNSLCPNYAHHLATLQLQLSSSFIQTQPLIPSLSSSILSQFTSNFSKSMTIRSRNNFISTYELISSSLTIDLSASFSSLSKPVPGSPVFSPFSTLVSDQASSFKFLPRVTATISPTKAMPLPVSSYVDEIYFTNGSNSYDIYSPRFDGVDSFLSLASERDRIASSNELSFRFKSRISNGILVSSFQQLSNRKFFVIIYIADSRLKAGFSCNSVELSLMEHSKSIQLEKWYYLAFSLVFEPNFCNASFSVDWLEEIKTEQSHNLLVSEWPCFNEIVFGSSKSWLKDLPFLIKQNFKGCISDIRADGFTRIKSFNKLQECEPKSLASCKVSVCGTNGKCLTRDNSWFCQCKPGFSGKQCQRASCDSNPCLNGGLCIQINRGQISCLCNRGWFGYYCELSSNTTIPAFEVEKQGSESYAIYSSVSNISDHLELRFRFSVNRKIHNNSLLLFIAHVESRKRQQNGGFMCLSLIDDHVVVQVNFGYGTQFLSAKLSAKSVHSVYFGQHGKFAWVVVDGLKKDMAVLSNRDNRIKFEPYFYLGNYRPAPMNNFAWFEGCIFDLESRSAMNSPFKTLDVLWSWNVLNCPNVHRCRKSNKM